MTRCAIMQPTYLPWSGYFGLMQAVDVFVLLDSVQFSRRSWQQRNQIKTAHGAKWLSVPVLSKGRRQQLLREVELDLSSGFAESHCRSIALNYSKAPHFSDYANELFPLLNPCGPLLTDLTIALIHELKEKLGITTCILRASELDGVGCKADLLASICEQTGTSTYVSPPGSKIYLDDSDAFERIGVPVKYFSFKHPEYSQLHGEFLPNMSVIDMMFNCGDRSYSLIQDASEIVE